MIKLTIDTTTNTITKMEQITERVVEVDFDINDNIVIDSDSGEIVLYKNSSQGQEEIKELENKDRNKFEHYRYYYLIGKDAPMYEYPEIAPEKYLVNITSKDGKKYTVVHKEPSGIEYDPERGDKLFDSEKEAQAYADDFNSKQ